MIRKIIRKIQSKQKDVKDAKEKLQLSCASFISTENGDGVIVPAKFCFIKKEKRNNNIRYFFHKEGNSKTIYVVIGRRERAEITNMFNERADNQFCYKYSLVMNNEVKHLFVIPNSNIVALMSDEGCIMYLPILSEF